MNPHPLHPLHQELLAAIESLASAENIPLAQGNRYVGTSKPVYLMKSASIGLIFRDFTRRHPDLSSAEFVLLLDSLSQGETYNEYTAVGVLLNAYPKLRRELEPVQQRICTQKGALRLNGRRWDRLRGGRFSGF